MIVDEPDWEACIAAAEEVTGLPVDRHTTSIIIREVRKWLSEQPAEPVPLDMVLYCPNCGMQHVDEAEELPMAMPGSAFEGSAGWTNPPHRSHLCHGCGTIWRPANVPTNGVAEIKTSGKADTWPVNAKEITAQPALKPNRVDQLYARIGEQAMTLPPQPAPSEPAVRSTGFVAPRDRYVPPVLFNPYSGEPRDVRDVQSDPQGILIRPPGADMLAAPPQPAAKGGAA